VLEELDRKYGRSSLKKNKHGKYLIHILYYQRMEGEGGNPSSYGLKRRKLVLGGADIADYADGVNNVHPMIVKAMKTRYKNLLLSSPSFNYQNFKDSGEFLSKKFWQVNLLWGDSDKLSENFNSAVAFIRAHHSQMSVPLSAKAKKSPPPSLTSSKKIVPPSQGGVTPQVPLASGGTLPLVQ